MNFAASGQWLAGPAGPAGQGARAVNFTRGHEVPGQRGEARRGIGCIMGHQIKRLPTGLGRILLLNLSAGRKLL